MRKQRTRKLQSKPHAVNGRILTYCNASHSQRVIKLIARNRFTTLAVRVAVVLLAVMICVALFVMRSQFFNDSATHNISHAHQSVQKVEKPEFVVRKHKNHAWQGFNPNSAAVKNVLSKMSLEDKVAQMFMVKPEELVGSYNAVTISGSPMQQAFTTLPVGGVMLSRENIQNPEQTQRMISGLQAMSQSRVALPALVSVDEEGGTVARVSSNPAMGVKASPNMSDIGATHKPLKAYKIGKYIGNYLFQLGFNVDFAPVADVLTNPNNTLMQKRAFGSRALTVASMASAFADGLQNSHVFSTYKHFPGHGSTFADSHQGLTVSNQTPLALRKVDLVPFRDAIAHGVEFIMVSHVSYPKITGDDTPASMSEKIVTGIARNKLGYKGILISDSLGMGAVSLRYTPGNAAITGIKAGLDILLGSPNSRQAYYAVVNAVRQGIITSNRIDESVKRIIAVKLQIAHQQNSHRK